VAEKSFRSFARVFTSVLCASLVSFNEREEDIFLPNSLFLSFDFSRFKKKKTREKRLLSQLSFSKKKKRYIEHVFELEEGSSLKRFFCNVAELLLLVFVDARRVVVVVVVVAFDEENIIECSESVFFVFFVLCNKARRRRTTVVRARAMEQRKILRGEILRHG
jgi:hypothetical protein